jgi:hypothetical protein
LVVLHEVDVLRLMDLRFLFGHQPVVLEFLLLFFIVVLNRLRDDLERLGNVPMYLSSLREDHALVDDFTNERVDEPVKLVIAVAFHELDEVS